MARFFLPFRSRASLAQGAMEPRRILEVRQFEERDMMTRARILSSISAAAVLVLAGQGPARANHEGTAHEAPHHHSTQAQTGNGATSGTPPLNEVSAAYEAAMQKMHKDMAIPYTGDVDVDFVRGMIPHHQGAIEQANVLLKYSKNLRLRRLAGGIIAAQKREIRFMKRWLEEHDRGLTPSELPDWLKNAPATAEEADKADESGSN